MFHTNRYYNNMYRTHLKETERIFTSLIAPSMKRKDDFLLIPQVNDRKVNRP